MPNIKATTIGGSDALAPLPVHIHASIFSEQKKRSSVKNEKRLESGKIPTL
jgi:hypothetical protein